jgi:hypothetical protein
VSALFECGERLEATLVTPDELDFADGADCGLGPDPEVFVVADE